MTSSASGPGPAAEDDDKVLFLRTTPIGGKPNIAVVKGCVVSAAVFQLTVQQSKHKQCSAVFRACHYMDSNREDQPGIIPYADATACEA